MADPCGAAPPEELFGIGPCVNEGPCYAPELHHDGNMLWWPALDPRPPKRSKKAILDEMASGSEKQHKVGPPNLEGDRHGVTYERKFDLDRLNAQMRRVYDAMSDQQFWTLAELSEVTGDPEASVSARIRDLRKKEFGAHDVDRVRVTDGLYKYRLYI